MNYRKVRVADLELPDNNARTHDNFQIAALNEAIREFGFMSSVVVNADNLVIAGAARVLAARRDGLAEIPAAVLEAGEWTENQEREYALLDNHIHDMGEDDDEAMHEMVNRLSGDGFFEMEKFGLGFMVDGMSKIVYEMLRKGATDDEVTAALGLSVYELERLKHITGYAKLYKDHKYSRAWLKSEKAKRFENSYEADSRFGYHGVEGRLGKN